MPRGSNPQAGKPEQATSCQSGRAPSCSGADPPGRVGRMRTGLHLPTVRLVHELVVPCSPQATEVKEQTVSITRECRQDYIGAPRGSNPQPGNRRWLRPATLVAHFSSRAGPGLSRARRGMQGIILIQTVFPGKPVNCSAAKEDQHDEPELQHRRSRRRRAGENVDQGRARRRRRQAPAGQCRPPAHRVQAHRGHAGRAPGHRRDRRLGDPDPQGHHSGGGGRGHRLRHDGGKTTLRAEDLPDNLGPLRSAIEQAVPHGSAPRGRRDTGSWENPPVSVDQVWATLADEFDALCELHPRLRNTNNRKHLGTLGTGNHFIEVCLDEAGFVWFMLHSGAAWATPSARTSSSWPRRTRSATRATCRTRIWPISRKAPSISAIMCARCRGRRSSRCATAR